MLLEVAMGATAVTTMATMPMEETTTEATIVETVALPEATMETVDGEATLLVVSVFIASFIWCSIYQREML